MDQNAVTDALIASPRSQDGTLDTTSHRQILALAAHHDRLRRSGASHDEATDLHQLLRVKALVDRSPDIVYLVDATGTLVYANAAFERILGIPVDPAAWSRFELLHPDDVEKVKDALTTATASGSASDPLPVRVRDAEGEFRRLEIVIESLLDDPEVAAICVRGRESRDRETRRRPDDAEILRRAFDDAAIGMAVLGLDGRYLQVNPALCNLVGYSAGELLTMRYVDVTHPDDIDTSVELVQRALSGDRPSYQVEKRYVHRDGDVVWTRLGVSLVRDLDGAPQCFLVQILDITDRKRLEERLAHDATHDVLTGLATRPLMFDRLGHAMAASRRYDGQVGLLFVDLDGFKAVNDNYGHAIGDAVLVEVAHRLAESVREIDTACRFGGDEFVVVCPHLGSAADAVRVAERIGTSLAMPFHGAVAGVRIGASIGVAVAGGETDPTELLSRADAAVYQVKQRGGGGWTLVEA